MLDSYQHFLACSASDFDALELECLFSAVTRKPDDSSKADGKRKSLGSKSEKVHLVTNGYQLLNSNSRTISMILFDAFFEVIVGFVACLRMLGC